MHFSGCGIAAYAALFVYLLSFCQRAVEDVLRRMTGPSLETGTVFDAVLSVNYCAIGVCMSVRAVQEKCDEKRQGRVLATTVADGTAVVGCSAGPPSAIAQDRLSQEARERAHPQLFSVLSKKPRVIFPR